MNITIYCVGKIKEKFYKQALDEYAKRLQRYCQFRIIEVSDEKTPDNASLTETNLILKKEGDRLLSKITDQTYLIALAINGKMRSSENLSEHLNGLMIHGTSEIGFVIGGSLGLSKDVLKRANESLSFSEMTFPHQLMRVILSEQIYRSFRIIHNEPYHK